MVIVKAKTIIRTISDLAGNCWLLRFICLGGFVSLLIEMCSDIRHTVFTISFHSLLYEITPLFRPSFSLTSLDLSIYFFPGTFFLCAAARAHAYHGIYACQGKYHNQRRACFLGGSEPTEVPGKRGPQTMVGLISSNFSSDLPLFRDISQAPGWTQYDDVPSGHLFV